MNYNKDVLPSQHLKLLRRSLCLSSWGELCSPPVPNGGRTDFSFLGPLGRAPKKMWLRAWASLAGALELRGPQQF